MSVIGSAMKNHPERYRDTVREMAEVPVKVKKSLGKTVIMVLPIESHGADELEFEGARRDVCRYYISEGIPVFLTLERAARAFLNLVNYYDYLEASKLA